MVDFKILVGASLAPKNKLHRNHHLSNFFVAFPSELIVRVVFLDNVTWKQMFFLCSRMNLLNIHKFFSAMLSNWWEGKRQIRVENSKASSLPSKSNQAHISLLTLVLGTLVELVTCTRPFEFVYIVGCRTVNNLQL